MGMQRQQTSVQARQILEELLERMGASAPVAKAEFRQQLLDASNKPGKWQSATINYEEARQAWVGNYFVAETQTYTQGNEKAVFTCATFVSAAIIDSNDAAKVEEVLKSYKEKNNKVINVEFDGATISTSTADFPDGGRFYQIAVWQNQHATFVVQFEVSYQGKSNESISIVASQCPYAHQQLDIKKWYETFHAVSKKYTSSAPDSASATPSAAPELMPQVEIEYTSSGIPYRGVAADGVSYLKIALINTDPDSTVTVYPSTDVGELKLLDGRDVWQGNIIIPPLSNRQILYRPPAYISQDSALTERIKLDIDSATQVLWGQKASLSFEFITDEGASAVVQKEILVFRPPVRMVHGYLGSTETWTSMENYLGVNKFMSSSSNYRAAIELMAMDLKADILRMMEGYDRNGFRVGKVDLVSHSMGGLISRYLVERDSDPRNLVRKVIMLGTPNHGVDDMFDNARSWASWYTEMHQVAGEQLRYNDPFILSLNEGEREGRHLNPDVEYANIVGQISCLFRKEDGVVPHTSSHLNGVPIYIFADTVHTGAVEYVCDTLKAENKDISITESQLVFAKVRELLLRPIPREQFENSSIQVIKGDGEVAVREPDSSQPWELLLNYPAQLEPYYHLQTGDNSKAVIGLYLNQERWGLVALAPNSEIMFRYSSPATVSLWMVKGKARFMARRDNHKKFEIAIGQKYNKTWQTLRPQASVFDQDTDFVISAFEQIEVYSLDGRVQIEAQNEDPNAVPQYVQKVINGKQGANVSANTIYDTSQPPAAWWSDEFYPQNISADESSALSQNWFYWGAIPGVFCFGIAFLLLIVGHLRNDGRLKNIGVTGFVITACLTLMAISVFIASRVAQISATRPENMPPADGIRAANTPSPAPPAALEIPLSDSGPWILFSAENGLWAMNEDGSALTQLTRERIVAPPELSAGISSQHSYFAYITASDASAYQDLKLNVIRLPGGEIKTVTALISDEMKPAPGANLCEPKFEAARAAARGDLQWSPDGSKLAFVGALQGESADVYVYSLQDESVIRVSDEPGQAYDLHWSPSGKTIAYFSAECFGTGAGFNMEGAWAVDTNARKAEKIYEPSAESWGEKFVAWSRSGAESFFVSAFSGCPQRDLRLADISSKEVRTIFEGCFEDIAVGPTSSLAVLTSADFSEQPGLYIYGEPDIFGVPPVYAPIENGRKVRYAGSQFLVLSANSDGMEIHSFDWNGGAGWYRGKGDFPFIAPGEQTWAWNENGWFYLTGKEFGAPVKLSENVGVYALWNEDVTASGEIYQRLCFFSGINGDELYLASAPDYLPKLISKNIKPLAAPAVIFR